MGNKVNPIILWVSNLDNKMLNGTLKLYGLNF
jgi:hypothetical protein